MKIVLFTIILNGLNILELLKYNVWNKSYFRKPRLCALRVKALMHLSVVSMPSSDLRFSEKRFAVLMFVTLHCLKKYNVLKTYNVWNKSYFRKQRLCALRFKAWMYISVSTYVEMIYWTGSRSWIHDNDDCNYLMWTLPRHSVLWLGTHIQWSPHLLWDKFHFLQTEL